MNKQEKWNKIAKNLVELQYAQLSADKIEQYIKEALYDDIGAHGNADDELTSQAIALFWGNDEEGEKQFYLDNGFTDKEASKFMDYGEDTSVSKSDHPLYWKG